MFYLPLCQYCKSCVYFRDLGIGFCVHPRILEVERDKINLDDRCPLFMRVPGAGLD